MAETKELGKIDDITFGFGGYQDAMFGVSVSLKMGEYSGCGDFISGGWENSIEVTEYTKWTEEERGTQRVAMCNRVEQLMVDAGVRDFSKLKGKPIEVTMDGMVMKSWRILKEVL